jgi:hypothetical protein
MKQFLHWKGNKYLLFGIFIGDTGSYSPSRHAKGILYRKQTGNMNPYLM